MRSREKVILGLLALNSLFVGCSSLSQAPAGVGLDTVEGSMVVSRGTFFVTDLNRNSEHSLTTAVDYWNPAPDSKLRTDISCQVFRVRPPSARNWASILSEGDLRTLEMQGSVAIGESKTQFVLTMMYRRAHGTPGGQKAPALVDDQLKPTISNGNMAISVIDPKSFRWDVRSPHWEVKIPFDVSQGLWEGVAIHIQCTRDASLKDDEPFLNFLFGWLVDSHPKKTTRDGYFAFRSPSQVFQVVDASNRLLGYVSKKDYQVFDSVPPDKINSMVSLLGVIRSIQLFYETVYDYRNNWGPETGEMVLDGRLPDFEFLYR